jgi:hypothetical protein
VKDRPVHMLAGRIVEIEDDFILLGFSSAPIRVTAELAKGFHPGQRVTITAVLVNGEFIAQKIEAT